MTGSPEYPPLLRKIIDDSAFEGDPPLDADVLGRAAQFMSTVRQIQRDSGRHLTGKKGLSDEILDASAETFQRSKLLIYLARSPDPVVSSAILEHVFEMFEEMCRRRDVMLPTDLRPAVYRQLGIELVNNIYVFKAKPEQIASATIYNGSLDQLLEAYPEFGDTPGVYRNAVSNYPCKPEAWLHQVQLAINRLRQDERFADLRDMPRVFLLAATQYPSDPEGYLMRVKQAIHRLGSNERFADLSDMPGIFKHAAVSYTLDPERFLQRVQRTVSRLSQDKRFADLRDMASVFQTAAVYYPSDPENYLQRVQKAVSRLNQDERFADLRDTPGIFRRAAFHYPSDPESYLLKFLDNRSQESNADLKTTEFAPTTAA